MKEKISRNKISRHYKSFFGLENMALAENDSLMIDWGESLINELVNQEVERRIKERMNEDKEPYMGWCEVNGCNNEGASGGCYWSDTGYWTICSKHGEDCRNGLPQPKMKVEAVEREKNRDPQTGFLRSRLTPQVQKTEGGQ